jgi:lycopene cyclase domain-containing protein
MKYTYLLIDFFTILFPFLLSFHPQSNFYKSWKVFFPALFITGIIFVFWDAYFTFLGVWGFNPKYVIGVYLGNLPLEEILFFVCIPYACVFSFCRFYQDVDKTLSAKTERFVTILLLAGYTAMALIYHGRKYTFTAFSVLILVHLIAIYVLKIKWLTKFYIVYSFLLVPFLLVNGLLTGTGLNQPVVWYNSKEIIGIRLLTIPVEDVFYGMDLILINLLIYSKGAGGLFHNSHQGVPGE